MRICADGMLVQVFRPDAVEAEIHIAGRKKAYACEKVDESGYFAVCIPIKKQTAYTVCIEDIKGQKKEIYGPLCVRHGFNGRAAQKTCGRR